ncbi:hypothetical protein [Streptomyces clavifer]|uniref:hypothetical protein n=1 Tax=Streptomyces clavifer TaxID=68188 RepID=UPI00308D8E64|nr:hypothetical protein OG388_16095 [Streptomyces clavifer]
MGCRLAKREAEALPLSPRLLPPALLAPWRGDDEAGPGCGDHLTEGRVGEEYDRGYTAPVAFPEEILPDVIKHLEPLEHYAGAGRDRRVSLDPQGGQLRVITFRDDWIKVCHGAGIAAAFALAICAIRETTSSLPRPVRVS